MAVSDPSGGALNPAMGALLFERLPDRIFAPLASTNRRRYWGLLCRLHQYRFGPEAPLPPSTGFPPRVIVQDIEHEMMLHDDWEDESQGEALTPLNVRANNAFTYLADSGWFRLERHGVEKRVTMRPAVSQYLTQLIAFADRGPVFISGKIRSIDFNIRSVLEGEASGESLQEAAEQARNLLEYVRNTSTNIRDLMEQLGAESATRQYVQKFFTSYIEEVFIGDYRDLRTREHPLSRRSQILARIEEIDGSPAHRARLQAWYESMRAPGDAKKAARLFERDISRLLEISRIDEYLDRLDDEIRRANKRALTYLDYRLRSLQPVDALIRQIAGRIAAGGLSTLGDPFPAGELVSAERLAEPRIVAKRPPPTALIRQVPSEREIARAQIMLRARAARTMTPARLSAFVLANLADKEAIGHDELKISGVSDLRAFQVLQMHSLALAAQSRRLQFAALSACRGFRVTASDQSESPHPLISGAPFLVAARKPKTMTEEKP